jgi:hypothetical protein
MRSVRLVDIEGGRDVGQTDGTALLDHVVERLETSGQGLE